jgi:hypothetical protein
MSKNSQTTFKLGTSQNVSFTATAANATAIGAFTQTVRLAPNVNCRVSTTGTAGATSTLLFGGIPEYFTINPGQVISVIRDTADGVLNITEMTQ